MNNAPTVYVPTPPEGNGLTLPTLFSLLAHGIILGLLIYTYQQPELENTSAIETTMISPAELAEMQGQILANRAANTQIASGNDVSASEQIDIPDSYNSNDASQGSIQSSSQRVPVFTRSDDSASQPLLMSSEQHQQRLEQIEEYNRNMAEWAAELDNTTNAKLDDVQQDQKNSLLEERETLKDYQGKRNNPPKIEKPTSDQDNIKIKKGDSGNAQENYSLAEGRPTAGASTSSSKNSGGSSSRSIGEFKRGIADKIQRNLKAPIETQGITARVTLRLDARGNVLSATASGSNAEVNKAAEKAAFASSPLPIDLDNPSSLENLAINVKVQ